MCFAEVLTAISRKSVKSDLKGEEVPPLTTQGPALPAPINLSAAFSVNEPDSDSVFRQQFPQLPARQELRLGPEVPLAHHVSRTALLLELFRVGDLVRMKAQVTVGPSIGIDSHVEPGALGLSPCQNAAREGEQIEAAVWKLVNIIPSAAKRSR